jgi:hypothetical protein
MPKRKKAVAVDPVAAEELLGLLGLPFSDEPPPPPKFIIEEVTSEGRVGILPHGQIIHLRGMSGSGKSLMINHLFGHIAISRRWCGYTTHGGGAVIVRPRDSKTTKAQLWALYQHLEVAHIPPIIRHINFNPVAENAIVDKSQFVERIIELHKQIGIVVVALDFSKDTLTTHATYSQELAQMIVEEIGATVLLIQNGDQLDNAIAGPDGYWHMELSEDGYIVLLMELMSYNDTMGRIVFGIKNIDGHGFLVPTSANPLLRRMNQLKGPQKAVFKLVHERVGAWNGYRICEDEAVDVISESGLPELRDKDGNPKARREITQQALRWISQIAFSGYFYRKNKGTKAQPEWWVIVSPRLRNVRQHNDLLLGVEAEKLYERTVEAEMETQAKVRAKAPKKPNH